jgi:hypothetical protein
MAAGSARRPHSPRRGGSGRRWMYSQGREAHRPVLGLARNSQLLRELHGPELGNDHAGPDLTVGSGPSSLSAHAPRMSGCARRRVPRTPCSLQEVRRTRRAIHAGHRGRRGHGRHTTSATGAPDEYRAQARALRFASWRQHVQKRPRKYSDEDCNRQHDSSGALHVALSSRKSTRTDAVLCERAHDRPNPDRGTGHRPGAALRTRLLRLCETIGPATAQCPSAPMHAVAHPRRASC